MLGVKVENNVGNDNDKPKRVTLQPGKTAWFQLFYTDGVISADRKSPAPDSYKIKVKAPRTDKEFVIKSQIHTYKEAVVYFLREGLPD